jgi:hypothetical protein
MATFTRFFIGAVLLIQAGIAEAGLHTGHGHLHGRDLNLFSKRAAQINPTLPGNWTYKSCMTDNVNSRALYAKATTSADMTETKCVNFCDSNGYAYGMSAAIVPRTELI